MTLLAGVYARNAEDSVPDSICNEIKRSLSRYPDEHLESFHTQRCFFAKIDIGAYGSPAREIAPSGATFVAGEPLVPRSGNTAPPRSADVLALHKDFLQGDFETLALTRGIFCAAHYQTSSGALFLATDKLGLRPMYYWLGERFVVFATSLRVMERIAAVPKTMDVRGVTEVYAFDYALSDRTPYAAVKLLRSGEVLRVDGMNASQRYYWRWDDIESSDRPLAELAQEAYSTFQNAVSLRNRGDTSTAAFLSGGLDSRAIVMALVQQGLDVHTFNFSVTGTQDQVFGAEFARLAGTTHTERPRRHRAQIATMMAETWKEATAASPGIAERPQMVWSGGGGSVTLGHVFLTRPMVDLARKGKLDEALELYRRACASEVPSRLLKGGLRDTLPRIAHEGVLQELAELHCSDAGRRLYLFLMLNDQRRHTADHLEDIDLSRLEYHLPFYDAEFVSAVMRVPIDSCLDHGFYMQWLRLFPEITTAVPWQAYPGHEPCPLPIPSGLTYQWEDAEVARVRAAHRQELLTQAATMLRARDFPKPLLEKQWLRLATLIYKLGLRDVGHVIGAAHVYYKYWSQCEGRYTVPTAIRADAARAQ